MKQRWNRALFLMTAIWVVTEFTPFASAADYPSRPVKIITQGAAGSGPDVIAMLVADGLGRLWQQQVLIVNDLGGGGVVAVSGVSAYETDLAA